MISIKPLIIRASNDKKDFKKKTVENRKADVQSILKTLNDISKKEKERSKKLYNDHVLFFSDEEHKHTHTHTHVDLVTNDDQFFE